MNRRTALAHIRERGYLNRFSTMGDTWWCAHSVPGGEAEDAIEIPSNMALWLIQLGEVIPAGKGDDLAERDQCFISWFVPNPAKAKAAKS